MKSDKVNLVGSETHQILAYIRIILVIFFFFGENVSLVKTWIFMSWPQNFRCKW